MISVINLERAVRRQRPWVGACSGTGHLDPGLPYTAAVDEKNEAIDLCLAPPRSTGPRVVMGVCCG